MHLFNYNKIICVIFVAACLKSYNNITKQYNKYKNCKCPNFSTDHQNFLADHRLAIAVLDDIEETDPEED
jgi:hypothetical protein